MLKIHVILCPFIFLFEYMMKWRLHDEYAWLKSNFFFSILWRIFQVISELLRPLTANWKLSLLPVPEFAMSFRKKKKKKRTLQVKFSIN